MNIFLASPQQADVLDWVEFGTGSAQVEAVSGSGKTTTLIQALLRMRGSVAFLAFNVAIAKEIKAKIAAMLEDLIHQHNLDLEQGEPTKLIADQLAALKRVQVSTVHGAGMRAIRRMWSEASERQDYVNENKVRDLVQTLAEMERQEHADDDQDDAANIIACEAFICKMVSFGKQFLMGVKRPVTNMIVWQKLAEHFGADEYLPEGGDVDLSTALGWVAQIFQMSHDMCPDYVDFDDMIYAPIAYNMRLFQNDWVLMDEDQDANPARRELAKRMCKNHHFKAGGPKGRFLGVGDRNQAIYGFTGAGADSIERIIAEFGCKEMPLTVTYRCPRKVVDFVHQWVSHIQAHPDAPEGVVADVATDPKCKDPWYVQCKPEPTDAILCRYTKPLIQTAYGMIKHGIACKVEGRDIGKGLISLVTRWKVKTLDALEGRLAKYLDREIKKARVARSDKREQDAIDRVDTVKIFIERCRAKGHHTIQCVVTEIEALFADDVTGVTTLATGHKAKGREWHRVYWLRHTQRACRQAWEDQQEINLNYVIGTRAKVELILVKEALQ